jgi:hypothetical protein
MYIYGVSKHYSGDMYDSGPEYFFTSKKKAIKWCKEFHKSQHPDAKRFCQELTFKKWEWAQAQWNSNKINFCFNSIKDPDCYFYYKIRRYIAK